MVLCIDAATFQSSEFWPSKHSAGWTYWKLVLPGAVLSTKPTQTAQSMAQYLFCHAGPIDIRKQYIVEDLLKHTKKTDVAVRNGSNTINNLNNNSIPEATMDNHIDNLSFKSSQQNIRKKNLPDESKERMISLYDA